MKRHHHAMGYSFTVGAGTGLLLAQRPILVFLGGFIAGLVAMWFYRTAATLADHWIWKRKRTLAARPMAKRPAQTDEIPF